MSLTLASCSYWDGFLSMFPFRSSVMRFNNGGDGFDSDFGGWRHLRNLRFLVDEFIGKVADPSLRADL